MKGFQLRFGPSYGALREAVSSGEAGPVEQVIISFRDPAPPSIDQEAAC